MRLSRPGSLGLGESHPVVVPVEDGVVLANEHVSQDPQGPGRGGNVQAHETTQAYGLSGLRDLFDRRETESEREKNKRGPQTKLQCLLLNDATVTPLLQRHPPVSPPAGGRGSYLEDVLVSAQAEGLPTDVEGDDRKCWDLVTAHHVLKPRRNCNF